MTMSHSSTNARKISHKDLIENAATFHEVTADFEPDALRSVGLMRIVGRDQPTPLHIVVEWDSMTVLLGYAWDGGNGWSRPQRGFESWFWASEILAAEMEIAERYNLAPRRSDYQSLRADQNLVLKKCLACQNYLDSLPYADVSANPEIKAEARNILLNLAFSEKEIVHEYSSMENS